MLAQLHIAGSAFDLGLRLGQFGRQAVQAKLRPLPLWQRLAALANTPKAQEMQTLVRQMFPRYWQEVEGLAAGLELSCGTAVETSPGFPVSMVAPPCMARRDWAL